MNDEAMQNDQCPDIEVAYSEEYDAYYYVDTGEWIDPRCGDMDCPFCNGRPENMKAEHVAKTEKDRHEKMPPQRKPLTEEELSHIYEEYHDCYGQPINANENWAYERAIEAAHGIKEKNT